MERRLAAILAADMVGYSRLMGADEEGTIARQREHRAALIDPEIAGHGGRIVKTMGDGLLVEFASVVDALKCAVAVQAGMHAREGETPEERRIQFRIGINLGDIVIDGDDILGDGVNVAARLEGLAEPGGICISDVVHQSVVGKLDLNFSDMGAQQVKNIDRPVRVFQVLLSGTDEAEVEAPALPDKPSIAVLPFNNMSGDPEQEYFADGIAEDVIADLSKVSGLFVIARNSSFAYRGESFDLREVCRDLGVRYVLEGSVRRAGNRVRINAQLIEGGTGGHIWAERFDRDLEDIFAVQDEVTREIVDALQVALTDGEQTRRTRRRKVDPEAYDLLVRGRECIYQFSEQAMVESRALLERAITIAPDLAAAHANLALVHSTEYLNGWNNPGPDHLAKAVIIAEHACMIDPEEPQGFLALALVKLWLGEYSDAERAASRSVEINPNFASGFTALGSVRDLTGEHESAVDCAKKALGLDPHYHTALQLLGRALFALGRDEEATASFEQRIVQSPNSDMSRAFLAAIHGHSGRHEEARQRWQEIMVLNPNFSVANVRRTLDYKSPAPLDRLVEGLNKAGLPAE
ncbi:MAG: adenylate/guanylate cyclase domain-containing protein [Alphaproteobacteria bacterium]|nr:adenylate/guanylate cyclase domain-containing protein [Alphaproteobacteria bacterium]